VSVELGSVIVGVSQFVGVIGGGLFMKCGLGFRKMYIIAQFGMAAFLAMIGYFETKHYDDLLIVCISLFLFIYQALMGNGFWPYAAEAVVTESGFSLAQMVIWIGVLAMATCTELLFSSLTVTGTFYFFSGLSLIGGVFYLFFMKELRGVDKAKVPLLYLPKEMVEEMENSNKP
jgi:predicted MFS family arabinose efflux permease